jgi:hypothetical protein
MPSRMMMNPITPPITMPITSVIPKSIFIEFNAVNKWPCRQVFSGAPAPKIDHLAITGGDGGKRYVKGISGKEFVQEGVQLGKLGGEDRIRRRGLSNLVEVNGVSQQGHGQTILFVFIRVGQLKSIDFIIDFLDYFANGLFVFRLDLKRVWPASYDNRNALRLLLRHTLIVIQPLDALIDLSNVLIYLCSKLFGLLSFRCGFTSVLPLSMIILIALIGFRQRFSQAADFVAEQFIFFP